MTKRTLITSICLAAALLAGCSSPKATFYTLNPVSAPNSAVPAIDAVSVGPVSLPALLDRPQLVVRTAPNRVDFLETHRWAEPLKSELPRVIAADLTRLLNEARVSAYPQNTGLDADLRVVVDIQRLEMTVGEGAVLEALWSVRRASGGNPQTGRTVVREPAGGSGYDALVAARSRALGELSRDIAKALVAVAAAARQ